MKAADGGSRRLRRWAKVLLGRELAYRLDLRSPTTWFGSAYGGWSVCVDSLRPSPVVYAFGIGEDVSFELALQAACGGEVHSFDPTPRSLEWVERQALPAALTVHPWGLLDLDGSVELHPPERPDHVSHTIVGPAGAEGGVEVEVLRLETIRRRLGHRRIDLMKMDIEGAEYRVVEDLQRGGTVLPEQLLVEFHHGLYGFTVGDTRRAVDRLRGIGYRLAAVSPSGRELTFVHRGAAADPTAPERDKLSRSRGAAGGTMPRETTPIPLDAKIYVAGHRGLVGSAILRRLRSAGFTNLVTATRDQVDLRNQSAVSYWFRDHRPEYVFLVAGTVGGILANSTRPAEFIYDNLMIHATVVEAARSVGVEKLLYLGSSCIYPRACPQPIREEYLLSDFLEPTNAPYAVAKIAGIKLCQAYRKQYGCNFISAMPTNLYGPNDNFDLDSSHVLPALIRKFDEARESGSAQVSVWGTGSPRREFLHVDDLADACLFLMRHYEDDEHINVGTGQDVSIRQLAEEIRRVVAPGVELVFDPSKPDGSPRKLLDVSRLASLGWRYSIGLEEGIASTYRWFRDHRDEALAPRSEPVPSVSIG